MYQERREEAELAVTCSASLPNVDRFCGEAADLLRSHGLAAEVFAVELLLREVMNNAVLHGCQRDERRELFAMLTLTDETVVLQVTDPGPGFDWAQQLAAPDQPLSGSGRGMAILRGYAQEIDFNVAGNGVRLVRRCRAPVGGAPVGGAPVGGAPVGGAPAGGAPADTEPAIVANPGREA